jgi:hypothetical protein
MGPAQGMQPSSYRVEGYGMLSLLRFIFRLLSFCGSEPRCAAIHSDNSALITRIAKQLRHKHCYPNDTISSDWDVLQAIVATLRLFPQLPLVSHVKGHQDNVVAYAQLPLEAQLNVDADAAANLFQIEHGATRYIVPLIAGNSAQLFINNKTATYGYVKTIQNAYAYRRLYTYIGQRNKWDDTTLATVDWTSLGTHVIAIMINVTSR